MHVFDTKSVRFCYIMYRQSHVLADHFTFYLLALPESSHLQYFHGPLTSTVNVIDR
jgi:hypothetical protein